MISGEVLFMYCYEKDESIREFCMEDYVTYWCRYDGRDVIVYKNGVMESGQIINNGNDVIVGVDGYIVVICDIFETGYTEIREIIEDKVSVLEYLLR